MESYDMDLEIINTVKKGHHKFTETFNQVKDKIKSKTTFSNHLEQLVNSGIIKKTTKDKKPHYEIADSYPFDITEKMINKIELEISNIKEKSMKIPKTKLLGKFVNDTVKDLRFYSVFHFESFLFSEFADNQTLTEMLTNLSTVPYEQNLKTITNQKLKMLDKLIGTRIAILQKRDPKSLVTFSNLIKSKLIEK